MCDLDRSWIRPSFAQCARSTRACAAPCQGREQLQRRRIERPDGASAAPEPRRGSGFAPGAARIARASLTVIVLPSNFGEPGPTSGAAAGARPQLRVALGARRESSVHRGARSSRRAIRPGGLRTTSTVDDLDSPPAPSATRSSRTRSGCCPDVGAGLAEVRGQDDYRKRPTCYPRPLQERIRSRRGLGRAADAPSGRSIRRRLQPVRRP